MLLYQPSPGYWYADFTGQLQQVRVVLHEHGAMRRVVLENIAGQRQTISIDQWYLMSLTMHSPGSSGRRGKRQQKKSSK